MFVRVYPREAQEMVMDAHNKAFAFYGGVPLQMVYDNPKTIVDTVFVGKQRKFNRRFMALANHYLFEPVACTYYIDYERMGRDMELNGDIYTIETGFEEVHIFWNH